VEDSGPTLKPEAELLQWHERLSHMPLRRIQQLAVDGILPRRLARCKCLLCPACVYGKMTRRKWWNSPITKFITPHDVERGSMVSVDQLQSNIPGFIAQMKGTPTRKCYHIATVYVDHYSNFTYVHLQQPTSSEETLQSKRELERISSSYRVRI
jgi:GAG-pre-integrase domain